MMNLMLLLAQSPYQNRIKGLRGAFDNKQNDPMDVMLILVYIGVLVTVIMSLLIVNKIRLHKKSNQAPQQPYKLFNRVMKQMKIGASDRVLMRMLARSTHMPQPTVLFFSPELFEQHVERWTDSLSLKLLQDSARRRLDVISEKIFPPHSA